MAKLARSLGGTYGIAASVCHGGSVYVCARVCHCDGGFEHLHDKHPHALFFVIGAVRNAINVKFLVPEPGGR